MDGVKWTKQHVKLLVSMMARGEHLKRRGPQDKMRRGPAPRPGLEFARTFNASLAKSDKNEVTAEEVIEKIDEILTTRPLFAEALLKHRPARLTRGLWQIFERGLDRDGKHAECYHTSRIAKRPNNRPTTNTLGESDNSQEDAGHRNDNGATNDEAFQATVNGGDSDWGEAEEDNSGNGKAEISDSFVPTQKVPVAEDDMDWGCGEDEDMIMDDAWTNDGGPVLANSDFDTDGPVNKDSVGDSTLTGTDNTFLSKGDTYGNVLQDKENGDVKPTKEMSAVDDDMWGCGSPDTKD
ncbi:MAG: hypothetical protein M1829_001546 [Trizodia sp. TS-e1964]|nr:MAG: hypothetical protein M1829_001546 [Trizodia sp. TS-e1964]